MSVHHVALDKLYQQEQRGFYQKSCPSEDSNALGMCVQHPGGQGHWAQSPLSGAGRWQQGGTMGGSSPKERGSDDRDGDIFPPLRSERVCKLSLYSQGD